jgi:hypothetical protein
MVGRLFRKGAATEEEVDDEDNDDDDDYYYDAIGVVFLNVLKWYVNVKKISIYLLSFNI